MIYKTNEKIYNESDYILSNGQNLPLLTFADWEHLPGVRHCFTTRDGGVSDGIYRSLNFRRDADDSEENIQENFRRVSEYFGVDPDRIVCAHQTHTANVRIVDEADAGKGTVKGRDYADVDGLITNISNLVLFTSHADCVPLYFYDPIRRVIGLAHSGWRGTTNRIGANVIRLMRETYGSDPADIYVAIGPSICADCYEVSKDVADEVGSLLTESNEFNYRPTGRTDDGRNIDGNTVLTAGNTIDKFQLDLWGLNRIILLGAGVSSEHITVGNLCTCDNPNRLFSHRATCGRRGNLGAFIMIC